MQSANGSEERKRALSTRSRSRSRSVSSSGNSARSEDDDSSERQHTKRRKHNEHGAKELSKDKKKKEHKKKKKDKKGKKHKKKDKKEKDRLKQAEDILRAAGVSVDSAATAKGVLISDDDYYERATEFRVWMQRERGQYLEDFASTEDTRKVFRKFVKKWNAGELSADYYSGSMRSTNLDGSSLSKHKWAFANKLTETEKLALQSTRDTIDTLSLKSFQTVEKDVPSSSSSSSSFAPMKGPAALPPRDAFTREEQADSNQRQRKVSQKRFRKEHELVLEELVPKATGREAMIEKRKIKGAYARNTREVGGDLDVSEGDLMGGGGNSDFARVVAARDAAAQRRAQEKLRKVDEHRAKEKERMQQFMDSMGIKPGQWE